MRQRQLYIQTLFTAYLKNPSLLNESQLRVLAAQPFFKIMINQQMEAASKMTEAVSEQKATSPEEEPVTSEDDTNESRIGYYTKEERRQRISHYKEKLQRWRDGKC